MDDLKENSGYWELKKEALDHTLWGTRFGKNLWTYRKNTQRNELHYVCLALSGPLYANTQFWNKWKQFSENFP